MQLKERTLQKLRKIINGDGTAYYKSGPKLVEFFNRVATTIMDKAFPLGGFILMKILKGLTELLRSISALRRYFPSKIILRTLKNWIRRLQISINIWHLINGKLSERMIQLLLSGRTKLSLQNLKKRLLIYKKTIFSN